MNIDSSTTGMDREAEGDGGSDGDDGVKWNEEELELRRSGENAASRNDDRRNDDRKFGEGTKNTEREGLGVAIGNIRTTVDKVGDWFGDVEFGAGMTEVEKEHNDGRCDKNAGDSANELGTKWDTKETVGDKAGDAEQEDNDDAGTGNERRDETLGFFGDVASGRFVVEKGKGR